MISAVTKRQQQGVHVLKGLLYHDLLFLILRGVQWESEEHSGSVLHPVPLQAAAAAPAAVSAVISGASAARHSSEHRGGASEPA